MEGLTKFQFWKENKSELVGNTGLNMLMCLKNTNAKFYMIKVKIILQKCRAVSLEFVIGSRLCKARSVIVYNIICFLFS